MGELLLAAAGGGGLRALTLAGNCSAFDELAAFRPHGEGRGACCLAINHSGQALLSGGEDGSVVVSRRTGGELGKLPAPLDQRGAVRALTVTSNSRYLLSGAEDGTVRKWDLKGKRVARSFHCFSGAVTCIGINLSGSHFAAGGADGELVVFSLDSEKRVATLVSPAEENRSSSSTAVTGLHYSAFRKGVLASCTASGSVYVWDVATQSVTASFPRAHRAAASDVCFSPINRVLLVSVGQDKNLVFMDSAKSKVIKRIEGPEPLTSVSFGPSGDKIAVGTSEGGVLVYDLRAASTSTAVLRVEPRGTGPVRQLRFFLPPSVPSEGESTSVVSSRSREVVSGSSALGEVLQGQVERLESLVLDTREETRADMHNLQLEMMRQFRLQMSDISACLGEFSSKFAALVEENERLRAENERLKNVF